MMIRQSQEQNSQCDTTLANNFGALMRMSVRRERRTHRYSICLSIVIAVTTRGLRPVASA